MLPELPYRKRGRGDPFAASAEPVVPAKKTIRSEPIDDDFQPTYTDDDDIIDIEEDAEPKEAGDFEPVDENPVPGKKTTTRKVAAEPSTIVEEPAPEPRTRRRYSKVSDDSFGGEHGRGGKNESRKSGIIIN